MKSALILLFVGIVNCGQLLNPGQEYVYQYHGRLLTGIPQIDSTYAGLALQGKVIIQVTSQNTFKLQMRDVNFGTYNQKLSGPEQQNWRNVKVEANTPLDSHYKQMLESPVEFQLQQGEISSVKLSNQEPQWSVNMKKALISSLKVQLPGQQVLSSQQVDTTKNPRFWYAQSQMSQDQHSQNQYFWTVMEEGIEGKCENTYQVTELPQYMAQEYEEGMFSSQVCQGKKYFQVLRTRDITKCQDSVIFLSSKGHKHCLVGNCGCGKCENTKLSQTRLFGCGNSVNDFQLTGMINEGELRQNVIAFNTEQVVSGTKQVLKLQTVKEITQQIPEVQTPRTCHDLTYEYPQVNKQSPNSRQEMREILKSYMQQPRTLAFIPEISEKLSTEQAKSQIVQKLQQIAQELEDVENFAQKEIPSQLKNLKTVVSIMKTDDIKQMFLSIQSLSCTQQQKQTIRNLFIDIVRNAGTPSTVMFLKDMIEQEQLTEVESYMIIVTLNHYMKAPSEELIHQVFQLIKTQAVQKRFWLKGSANLVFASIVRNACLGNRKVHYPEELFGKMCSYNNQKITKEYIPYLIQELKNAQTSVEKEMALYAIGQIGHESVLPLLVSYMEGSNQDETHQLRKVALWALSDVAQHYREKLLPVFLAIAQNQAESRTLRIPAIAMIMELKPEVVHLQKLAVSTWFEQDHEVARYIYGTFREQANLDQASHPEGSYLKDLSQKAKVVLPLAKPIPMILSVNQIYSGYLQNLEIGAYMLNSLMYGTNSVEFYHKTEYFLKKAQNTPVELSVHMSGMKNIFQKLFTTVTKSESSLHPQLKEIIENLDISLRENDKFNVGAWMRLSDDINFGFELNQEDMSSLKSKVLSAIKDSGVSVMDKVCGKHQFNQQNIFEELPYQALVPSDLGLPIVVESQMTYFYSAQGEVNIECSFNKPSAHVSVAPKASYTYNGYAGTVCPFTQELLVAGINVHRAVNIPSKVQVEVEPKNGQFKIQVSQNDQIKSNNQAIDVLHYHVKPYTAKKQLVFKDMTPAILHSNTKILKSMATPKTYQNSFGQSFGVDASLKLKSECDVLDTKTMTDSWANFNYSPVAASWFFWAETALTAQGKPSARLHEYTVYINPSRSTSKAAEMTVQMTLASKHRDQEPRKFIIHSNQQTNIVKSQFLQQSSNTDMRLHDCLRKVDSLTGYALNAQINAKLIGGQEKSYSYSITAGAGKNELQHKWNLHFENEESSSMMKLCVNGQMSYPTNYNSNANFQYNNHISFGQTCDQYYVNVEGNSQVSSKVLEFSSSSEESKKCYEASKEDLRLRDLIKYEHNEITRSSLEQEHSKCVEKKLKYCTKMLEQSRALDQTDITITTSQTLPKPVYKWARMLNTAAKAILYQYLAEVSEPSQQQNRINVRLNFDPRIKTVNVQVQSPRDNVVFRNIRLPQTLQNALPLIAGQNPAETTFKAVWGKPYYAKCTIGQGYVQTFDKKSYSYHVDECDHVISSDCSKGLTHAVLAKEINGVKHVTLFHEQSKIELSPAHSYGLLDEYHLTVNGQQVQLQKNQQITLQSTQGQVTVYLSSDNTVEVNTPQTRLVHSGTTFTVEEKSNTDGSHCGLCGDNNQDMRADVKSSKGCVLSSSWLAAQSYRSKSSQCTPLSVETLNKIRSEEMNCVKFEISKTKIRSVFESEMRDSKSIMKHSIIHMDSKICFSQDPVIKCSVNTVPKQMRKKTVNFVCLPEGRIAKMYTEKVEQGEILQELKRQEVDFSMEMEQPISCRSFLF